MPRHDSKLAALEAAGHPVVRIVMKSIDHLGQEFFRFEMATAVAGSILGINPFDQPDVEAAKIKTRELTSAYEKTGALPAEEPVVSTAEFDLYTNDANATALRTMGANGDLTSWLKAHHHPLAAWRLFCPARLHRARQGHDRGAPGDADGRAREAASGDLPPNSDRASCTPRARPTRAGPTAACSSRSPPMMPRTWPVPGQKASFGVIKAAQARGDFDVLTERGRRALRVHLKGPLKKGLAALNAALNDALN